MSRFPCFNTVAARQKQRRIDAAAARGDAHARVLQELQVALLSAMQGIVTQVPGYVIRQNTQYVETERPYVDELTDALEHAEAFEKFLLILKDSECPMVAQLRLSLAAVYARITADGVAQARGVA